jgi:hypothetical protein
MPQRTINQIPENNSNENFNALSELDFLKKTGLDAAPPGVGRRSAP